MRAFEMGKLTNRVDQEGWDNRFLDLAAFYAGWSKDPSTKCGAVITRGKYQVSQGYNGFPKGIADTDGRLYNREEKYPRIIHADMHAVLLAGSKAEECTLYVWPFPPCADCAKHIIQAGVKRVVAPLCFDPGIVERWSTSYDLATDMFQEAGIIVLHKSETEEQEMSRAQR